MTRITYIENTLPVTLEVAHAVDLDIIGHSSIYCEQSGQVSMNTFDYSLWVKAHKELSVLKSIITRCMVCNQIYHDLMVSGDISEILNG